MKAADGHEPGGEVEALGAGYGEHVLAVFVDEGVLDLVLALALVDQPADEVALGPRLRRLGRKLQRDAADGAHHLVGDVGEVGLRLGSLGAGRAGDRRRGQDDHDHDRGGAVHASASISGSIRSRRISSVTAPGTW